MRARFGWLSYPVRHFAILLIADPFRKRAVPVSRKVIMLEDSE